MALAAGIAVAAVAAGSLGMVGTIKQGNEAKRAAFAQAERVEAVGRAQLTDLERRRGQTVAAQRQAYSARGVSLKGSPLLVLAETNELAARDAGRVQTHTTTQAYELRRAGTFAQQQSQIRAAGMGLSTVADVGGNVASGLSLGPASSPSVSTPLLRGVGSSRFGSSMPSYSVARFGE